MHPGLGFQNVSTSYACGICAYKAQHQENMKYMYVTKQLKLHLNHSDGQRNMEITRQF